MSYCSFSLLASVRMMRRPVSHASNARKRPVQQRSVATVDAILEAAARILETHGHAGYNTNDIARVAGISIGSLYQYFPNKDAITAGLVRREMTALVEAIVRATETAAGGDVLDQMIDAAVGQQLGRATLTRHLEIEEARLPPDPVLATERTRLMALLRGYFETSALTNAEKDLASDDVFAIVRGMVDSAGMRGETDAANLSTRIRRAVHGYLSHRT